MEEEEPFLASQLQSRPTRLQPFIDDHHFSFSFNTTLPLPHPHPRSNNIPPLIFPDIQDLSSVDASFSPGLSLSGTAHSAGAPNAPKKIHYKTAPAMAIMRDLNPHPPNHHDLNKPHSTSSSLLKQVVLLLLIYLSWLTICTNGYGNIAPLSPATKLFVCFFVLVGFGFVDILLSGVVNYVLDFQENIIMAGIHVRGTHGGFSARNYIGDVHKGRIRIRLKVGLALGVVVLCIGIGILVLYFVESLDWIDSIYLPVTTVGHGDRTFKTIPGRLFASIGFCSLHL
ncbi:unnamed protein product [Ilex paraguariensis]|uniref:Potassium channel domain-containing protein n=1 Tax=Ilex paraguariensis TaxID=185542 RepID=A0ABC8S6Q3_9AQUA